MNNTSRARRGPNTLSPDPATGVAFLPAAGGVVLLEMACGELIAKWIAVELIKIIYFISNQIE